MLMVVASVSTAARTTQGRFLARRNKIFFCLFLKAMVNLGERTFQWFQKRNSNFSRSKQALNSGSRTDVYDCMARYTAVFKRFTTNRRLEK